MNEGQQGAMVGSGGDGPRRDKHWVELSHSEKIERMRGEVKRLMRIVSAHDRGVYLLGEHTHGADGALLVPMNARSNRAEDVGYRRGEDWF